MIKERSNGGYYKPSVDVREIQNCASILAHLMHVVIRFVNGVGLYLTIWFAYLIILVSIFSIMHYNWFNIITNNIILIHIIVNKCINI